MGTAAFRRRDVRTIEPTAPKPMIIIAQVAGSGTAEVPPDQTRSGPSFAVNFAGTSAAPSRPEDQLAGTFVRKDGTGRWTFPSVPLDGSLSRAAFVEAVRDQVRMKTGGTAGID